MTNVVEGWSRTRRVLMADLAALPGEGDVVQWQRRIADAIIDAEQPPQDVDRADAKWHRHLLRVITDGLVHTLLPDHTIRSLSRHPGKPPALGGQGADLDFVFECARGLRAEGLIPIIADLTTLIGVGDIVGWNGAGVVVLECKNRTPPLVEPTTGRLARQRDRGEQIETYLTTSSVDEGETVRRAYPLDLPAPDWAAVGDLLDRCDASPTGMAAWTLGPEDVLLAGDADADPDGLSDLIPDSLTAAKPSVAYYSDLLRSATYRVRAPSSYPVSGEQRGRLLEGDLSLIRLVNLDGLAASFDFDGARVALVPYRSRGLVSVRVDVDGGEYTGFTEQLVEYCRWMPVPLAAMRQTLIDYTRVLLAERRTGVGLGEALDVAPGDNFTYATAYRAT